MATTSNPLIILADDDRHFVQIMAHHLRRWGFRVRESPTAENLLRLIEEEEPRVLLLDVRYGSDDGLVVLETVLRRWPALKVVVLTAYGTIQNAVLAIRRGACEYQTKPVDLEPMRRLLERLVGRTGTGSWGGHGAESGATAGNEAIREPGISNSDSLFAIPQEHPEDHSPFPMRQEIGAAEQASGIGRPRAWFTAEIDGTRNRSEYATLFQDESVADDDSAGVTSFRLDGESCEGLVPSFTTHLSRHPSRDGARATLDWVGKQLGRHEIVRQLGRGGIGVVYEAEDTLLNRRVAIKLMKETWNRPPHGMNAILREARLAARLNHPNVIAIFEIGQDRELFFLVMELASGGSLAESIAALGSLGWREATAAIADASLGLEAAHAMGLVHLDLKPSNLLRGEDGRIKLSDFGLARCCDPDPNGDVKRARISGTVHFMSPEQCRGGILDHRSDLYSLGSTYFTLLTGRPPYWGASTCAEIVAQHCMAPIPDPREYLPEIPDTCAEIVMRAMAKSPADRFDSAGEFREAARSALETGRERARAG
jgi:ActR/RegA family two-component response regulator